MSKNSICVKNIYKRYGVNLALSDISFNACRGEIIALLGANGAGKSTLIKVLAGVISPDSGDAKLEGDSVVKNRQVAQRRIGYLPEAVSGFENLTVLEFIEMSANWHGIQVDVLPNVISKCDTLFGLKPVYCELLGNLSKGWRQRAWLAQCFVSDPSIMFLDEPTDGLDPLQKIAIRKQIKIAGKRKTILMSTHILEEAEALCDRVLVVSNGRIVKIGTKSECLDKNGRLETMLKKLTQLN